MSRFVRAALALAAVATLGGCVSLFPHAKPVQLYALAPDLGAAPANGGAQQVNVRLESVKFEQAASGDKMLTMQGGEAAFIAGARWVSPAQTLFDEAVEQAFAEHARGVRLLPRASAAASAFALTLEVERFDVRYASPGAAPSAEIVLHARLLRYPDRTLVLDRQIVARRDAEANRVGAIVQAFNAASGAALGELIQATEAAAAGR